LYVCTCEVIVFGRCVCVQTMETNDFDDMVKRKKKAKRSEKVKSNTERREKKKNLEAG